MTIETTNPLTDELRQVAERIGFEGLSVLDERCEPKNFGNATVTFSWENLLLRFLRDRSIDHLDIGPASDPSKMHFAGLVLVMLGVQSLDDALSDKNAPLSAKDWLKAISENSEALKHAFSPARRHQTNLALEELLRCLNERRRLTAKDERP